MGLAFLVLNMTRLKMQITISILYQQNSGICAMQWVGEHSKRIHNYTTAHLYRTQLIIFRPYVIYCLLFIFDCVIEIKIVIS